MKVQTRPYALLLALALLAGCQPSGLAQSPKAADFSGELVDLKGRAGPPVRPAGACWQSDIRPAVIETVTEQVLASAEKRDAAGQITAPAIFSTESRQRIISDRGTVWFRSPCPDDMTPEFIATLQRALKARGLYLLPLSGSLDAATRTALRRYQSPRGIDSDQLSLAAARELGIVVGEF